MRYLKLVECSDYDVEYGIVHILDDTTKEEFQNAIYEVKRNYYENGFDDWTIEDVLEQIDCNFEYERIDGIVDI